MKRTNFEVKRYKNFSSVHDHKGKIGLIFPDENGYFAVSFPANIDVGIFKTEAEAVREIVFSSLICVN